MTRCAPSALGNSLPVIGLAVLSRVAGRQIAYPAFAAVIVTLAAMGVIAAWLEHRTQRASRSRAQTVQVRRDS